MWCSVGLLPCQVRAGRGVVWGRYLVRSGRVVVWCGAVTLSGRDGSCSNPRDFDWPCCGVVWGWTGLASPVCRGGGQAGSARVGLLLIDGTGPQLCTNTDTPRDVGVDRSAHTHRDRFTDSPRDVGVGRCAHRDRFTDTRINSCTGRQADMQTDTVWQSVHIPGGHQAVRSVDHVDLVGLWRRSLPN